LLKLLQPKRPSPKPRSLWSVKRAGLPDAAHTVMIEHRICADDRPARGLRLGDEQTVKWVFVMEGQKAGPHRIGGVDGKLTETWTCIISLHLARKDSALSFPILVLIASSHGTAAEIIIPLDLFPMANRAGGETLFGSSNHHRNTWVSSSAIIQSPARAALHP